MKIPEVVCSKAQFSYGLLNANSTKQFKGKKKQINRFSHGSHAEFFSLDNHLPVCYPNNELSSSSPKRLEKSNKCSDWLHGNLQKLELQALSTYE